jgi:hypothetical protein
MMSTDVSPLALEALEDRRHLSVTATSIAGPLSKGTAWTYKVTSAGTTSNVTNKVIGTTKVGKISTVEVDNTSSAAGSTTVTKDYVHLDTKTGLVSYKVSAKTTASTVFARTAIHVPSPYNTVYPAKMVAKTKYSFKWTDQLTTTTSLSSTPVIATATVNYTVKLSSDKTTKVTVPAGTFSCYTITTTLKTTENGQTTTVTATEYVAANVGVVKSVSGGSTSVLTKFVKGK